MQILTSFLIIFVPGAILVLTVQSLNQICNLAGHLFSQEMQKMNNNSKQQVIKGKIFRPVSAVLCFVLATVTAAWTIAPAIAQEAFNKLGYLTLCAFLYAAMAYWFDQHLVALGTADALTKALTTK